MAYVAGDGVTEFIPRSVYRARGYMPPFEELPSQDEYEAAEEEKQDIEADEAADVALALHQLEFLSIAVSAGVAERRTPPTCGYSPESFAPSAAAPWARLSGLPRLFAPC
jgi:hypothetical protein